MILNTGSRTDIPAYYSEWFYNRIKSGFCLVRNPYYPEQITRYTLTPEIVDGIVFCSKNPAPMLSRLDELHAFNTFWFVTITPYDKDVEPFVPDKLNVVNSFIELANKYGPSRMSWRYDPIFITERYDIGFHIASFEKYAKLLSGSTNQVVVSFIDLYEKTKNNFPIAREVTSEEQETIVDAFSRIARKYNFQIHLCCENKCLERENVDAEGCLSRSVLEKAFRTQLYVPSKSPARQNCACLLGADIGEYNTCGHGCLYCYANYDRETVLTNMKLHDPLSPLIIGNVTAYDTIKESRLQTWKNSQISILEL